MNKYVLHIVSFVYLCFAAFLTSAQTDDLNLEKYWKFRTDFVEHYIKIGPGKGESLPAGLRSPGICIDNASQWHNVEYGTMHWGDGMIRHGHYIGMLATEYILLKRNGVDTKGVLNELYYALEAINRLDRSAEPQLDELYGAEGYYSEVLNGYYLREDVGEGFCENWSDEPMNFGCTNSNYYHNNNVAKINDPDNGLIVKAKTSYQNVPSLDQMTSLLVGLSVAHKLLDNVYVKPTESDRGFVLREEVAAITERIVRYASDRNWLLLDVNGWPVGNGGGDLTLSAAPIISVAERITGNNNYKRIATRRLQRVANVQYCLTGFGLSSVNQEEACDQIHNFDLLENKAWLALQDGIPLGSRNNQNNSVYLDWLKHGVLKVPVKRLKWMWKKTVGNFYPRMYSDLHDDGKLDMLIWPLSAFDIGKDAITHYNNTIFFNLGVASGWWNSKQAHAWANATGNRQLELINALLTDSDPVGNMSFYQQFLNSFKPEGAYRLKGVNYEGHVLDTIVYQSNGWGSEYRWTHPEASFGDGGEEGIFSGLDYLYYHNLYYLIFGEELQPFKVKYSCFCEESAELQYQRDAPAEVKNAIQDLNRKLRYVPTCVENAVNGQSQLKASGVFKPKFDEYSQLGIRTVRYITSDVVIPEGMNLEINSDLVLADGVLLTLNGNLHIHKGVQLQLGHQSTLKMNGSATLHIEDGVVLNPEEDTKIEYQRESQLIVQDQSIRKVLIELGKE